MRKIFEGYIDNDGNPGVNPLAIELNRLTIRICGIDAPERGQYYGDVATRHLNYRIGGETVQLELIRKDRYGRWVAKVSINGLVEMILKGETIAPKTVNDSYLCAT